MNELLIFIPKYVFYIFIYTRNILPNTNLPKMKSRILQLANKLDHVSTQLKTVGVDLNEKYSSFSSVVSNIEQSKISESMDTQGRVVKDTEGGNPNLAALQQLYTHLQGH